MRLQNPDLNLRAQLTMSQPPRNYYSDGGAGRPSSQYASYARPQQNYNPQPQRPPNQPSHHSQILSVSPQLESRIACLESCATV
jgi:hypothetical protein